MPASEHASTHLARRMIKDDELLRLLLMGFTLRECAEQLKFNYTTVRTHAKEPAFLLRLREHSGEIAKRLVDELSTSQVEMARKLEEASSAALDEMLSMMNELGTGQLKVKVCQDLLDRDPKSSRTKRIDMTGAMTHEFISPAVLIHAAATAKELETFQKKGQLPDGDGSPNHHADSGNGQG